MFAVNGKAQSFTSDKWSVIPSGNSHAAAVNAGAAWARASGRFTHAILFDSDDFYGRGYLAQALAVLQHADYCGKRSIYTWLRDGLHRLERPAGKFMGGSLAFALDKFVPMPAVHQDDSEWCCAMEASGAVGVDSGPSEYCYVRHGANAHWRANDLIVRRAFGPALHYPSARMLDVSGDPGTGIVRPPPSDAQILEAM